MRAGIAVVSLELGDNLGEFSPESTLGAGFEAVVEDVDSNVEIVDNIEIADKVADNTELVVEEE